MNRDSVASSICINLSHRASQKAATSPDRKDTGLSGAAVLGA